MSVHSVDEESLSLADWLQTEEVGKAQRHLEERILKALFSLDPSSPAFQSLAAGLAWLGSRPMQKPLLAREIATLSDPTVEPCGLFKGLGKVTHFVSQHIWEITAGVGLVATGFGIAAVTGYAISASIGGVVVAGAGAVYESWKDKPCPKIPEVPLPSSKEELALFGEPLPSSLPKLDLPSSPTELLITPDGIWANGQFFSTASLNQHSSFSTGPQLDWKTFASYSDSFKEPSHQVRGETALALGQYSQALQDLEKATQANPLDPAPYLGRGIANFGLGKYEESLQDYQHFSSTVQIANPLSVSEFSLGFAKGLPQGIYESGEGMLLFFAGFIQHPIQTSSQVFDSIQTLVNLARQDEWGPIAEALSPEMHQLVTQWDSLSSAERGELAGFALGKCSADLLAPGALVKIASKSLKSAEELVAICKNLQIAQETLVLETAAGIGVPLKVAEIVEMGKKTAMLGEELGLTAQEMGQLKQAGRLEGTVTRAYETLSPSMKESYELFKKAQEFLKPYKGFMSESQVRELIHQTGIRTFPRPQGIPENFRVKISDNGVGMKYIHPTDEGTYVRVMPGKPHSLNPYQQKPYITCQKNGNTVDKYGNIVKKEAREAHISHEEFVYRE
jgi:tetratricopeptide (TPR) repeat protein